jgi:hypothetical protein
LAQAIHSPEGKGGDEKKVQAESNESHLRERRNGMIKHQFRWIFFPLLLVMLLPLMSIGAEKKQSIVGREVLNFTLPSTHDRVINYADEYYGKHLLVLTFFPAAFTPV